MSGRAHAAEDERTLRPARPTSERLRKRRVYDTMSVTALEPCLSRFNALQYVLQRAIYWDLHFFIAGRGVALEACLILSSCYL